MTQVVLIGAPGAGKTSVGRRLAQKLGCAFIDVDHRIEEIAGRTIGDIFANDGEPAFRAMEVEQTQAALAEPGVISLGGGAVMTESIRAALAGRNVVWLQVSLAEAARRVGLNQARPLLLGNVRGTLMKLLEQRIPVYQACSRWQVSTDDLNPEQVAEMIATLLDEAAPTTEEQ